MGLMATITTAGLPQEIQVLTELSGGFSITHYKTLDYTPAFETAREVFMEMATDLVPVRTGYLLSTIHADVGEGSLNMYADAEYAGYVEYGTWKMGAQPFFMPAVEAAQAIFIEEASAIIEQGYLDIIEHIAGYNMNGGAIGALQDQVYEEMLDMVNSLIGTLLGSLLVGALVAIASAVMSPTDRKKKKK